MFKARRSEVERLQAEMKELGRRVEAAESENATMREGFRILMDFADWWSEDEWEARRLKVEGCARDTDEPFKQHFQRVLAPHLAARPRRLAQVQSAETPPGET